MKINGFNSSVLKCRGEILITGFNSGDICGGNVTIKAHNSGDINADSVIINAHNSGDISAQHHVLIKAHNSGDIDSQGNITINAHNSGDISAQHKVILKGHNSAQIIAQTIDYMGLAITLEQIERMGIGETTTEQNGIILKRDAQKKWTATTANGNVDEVTPHGSRVKMVNIHGGSGGNSTITVNGSVNGKIISANGKSVIITSNDVTIIN